MHVVVYSVQLVTYTKEGNVLFNDALNTFYHGKGPFR